MYHRGLIILHLNTSCIYGRVLYYFFHLSLFEHISWKKIFKFIDLLWPNRYDFVFKWIIQHVKILYLCTNFASDRSPPLLLVVSIIWYLLLIGNNFFTDRTIIYYGVFIILFFVFIAAPLFNSIFSRFASHRILL